MANKSIARTEHDVSSLASEFTQLRREFSRITSLLEETARSAGTEAALRAQAMDEHVWVDTESGADESSDEVIPSSEAQFVSASVSEADKLERVQKLFGGKQVLGCVVKSQFEAHALLNKGLNAKALSYFVQRKVHHVPRSALLKAIGMSERTYQRHKEIPEKSVSPDQSGRAWKFAEILTEATSVFGSQERAERWLESPALGLNRRRPIDLLTTPAGVDIVKDFLGRVRYGVYT